MTSTSFPRLAPLLLALGVAACGGLATGESGQSIDANEGGSGGSGGTFPFATYSDCAWLLAGGTSESLASPGTLTLAPSCSLPGCDRSSIAASFQSGTTTSTFTLSVTSASSATSSSSQGFGGEWGYCGGGVTTFDGGGVAIADPEPAEATLDLTSADLAVDEGVVFLQMDGQVVNVQGSPGCSPDTPPSGGLSALMVCGKSSAASGSGAAHPSAATSLFVAGAYDCTSTAASVVSYEGETDNSTIGGSGTLTLTTSGSSLVAVYSGDTNASGTMDFVLTSARSASPVPGQTLTVGCGAIDPSTYGPVSSPASGAVTAGALTTDGNAIYMTFLSQTSAGTCAGQTAQTALVCTPKT